MLGLQPNNITVLTLIYILATDQTLPGFVRGDAKMQFTYIAEMDSRDKFWPEKNIRILFNPYKAK